MAKGGKYENTVIKIFAKEFKPLGIKAGDITRTKNSGASKDQVGDIHLSPAFVKLFPVVTECKHYKKLPFYRLCNPLHTQHSLLKKWWKQVSRDVKHKPKRFRLLVVRVNFCGDLAIFMPHEVYDKSRVNFTKFQDCFDNLIKTRWMTDIVWIMPLEEFLDHYTDQRMQHAGTKSRKRT